MIALLILLLLLLLLNWIRLGVLACYDADGPWVKVRVGPRYIQVYPIGKDPDKEAKKKQKKEAKAAKKAEKQAKKEAKNAAKPPKEPVKRPVGGLIAMVWDLLPVVGKAAGRFKNKLRIDDLTMDVTWAEEDPADAGIHYGQGWAVVEALLAWLEARFVIKNRQVSLNVDFLAEEPRIFIRAGLSLTLAQLLVLALAAAGGALKVLWNHRKTVFPPKKSAGAQEQKGEPNHGKEASCE